jgi:hypothetical protein
MGILPPTLTKNAGSSALWVKGREEGTLVDEILLTQDEDYNAEVASGGGPITILLGAEALGSVAVTWAALRAE